MLGVGRLGERLDGVLEPLKELVVHEARGEVAPARGVRQQAEVDDLVAMARVGTGKKLRAHEGSMQWA